MRNAPSAVPKLSTIAALSFVAVGGTAPAQEPPDVLIEVVDVDQGAGFGNPSDPIVWNGQLFFSADDGFPCSGVPDGETVGDELGEYGRELFTAGIGTGPVLIRDISTATSGNCDGVGSLLHEDAAATLDELIFRARSDPFSIRATGFEPWKTNGVPGTAELVADIVSGSEHSQPYGMAAVLGGTRVAFGATTFASGTEPWITDGTSAGTVQIADLVAGEDHSSPGAFTPLDATRFVFVATDDGPIGFELYVSDGTGATLLADIHPVVGSEIAFLTSFEGHGKIVFIAEDPLAGREPWVTDGTPGGTFRLADINPGSADSNDFSESTGDRVFTQVGDQMFFAAETASTGFELWVTDGTSAGTRLVRELVDGPGSGFFGQAAAFQGLLYFGARNGLWRSDGTAVGTFPVIDGGFGSTPRQLTAVGDLLYFTVGALWVTDGTAAGTVQPTQPAYTQPPRALTAVGDAFLAFAARTAAEGQEMFLAYAAPETIGPNVGLGFGPIPVGTFEDGTLTASASDENTGGSNIAGIEAQIDGGAWSPMPPLDGAYDSTFETGIVTVSFAAEGNHQACARATDVLGNLGDPACMDIEVVAGDSTPPEVTLLEVQPRPAAVGETAVLTVEVSDAATGASQIVLIEYQVDGGPWTSILPPADGFYDEAVEEGEADLVFDTAGAHEVCARAADAANNVSAPTCVGVSVEGPVGLMVKCLHEPLYPQTGEEVVIRARALDRAGNVVEADRVSIYVNSRSAPFDVAEGVEEHTVGFAADFQEILYGCRAERGDESAFSRFVAVDVGEPELGDFPAIPVLYHGPANQKIDLVFMTDAGSYPGGPLDPQFLEDMQLLVSDGLFEIPWFVEHQWVLNIWLATDAADIEPGDPGDGSSLCRKDKPPRYGRRYAFAEAVGILHEEACRDNFIPPGPFTTEFDDNALQVVAHEIGHAVFKLADEYTGSPTVRYSALPFPNLLASFPACQAAALARGKDPEPCRLLPGFAIGGSWIFEPDYDVGPSEVGKVRDLMQQTGAGPCSFDPDRTCLRYRVGDSEEARVRWKLGKCIEGNC